MDLKSPALKEHFKEFTKDIDRHEIFLLSASIAYTTALALAPFILILLSLASLMGADLQDQLYLELYINIGDQASETVEQIIKNSKESPTLSGVSGIVGFLVLVISSSAIFTQLRIALDKINEHKEKVKKSGLKSFLKDKFFSFGLVFGFAFLSIVSLIVSTALSAVFSEGEGLIWKTLSFGVNFVLFSLLFTAIYRIIPSDKLRMKTCLISGVVSTVFYLIGKTLIGLYVGKASFTSTYGAAGSVIALLAWVYYIALTLLVSYEFSKNIVLNENEKRKRSDSSQFVPV